jgi:hypothetical protein
VGVVKPATADLIKGSQGRKTFWKYHKFHIHLYKLCSRLSIIPRQGKVLFPFCQEPSCPATPHNQTSHWLFILRSPS